MRPELASRFVTRFAPSPTGLLHLGHAYSALKAFDVSQAADGRFILRIEDIDTTRCRPQFEAAIYEDLAWLGLAWEQPVLRQSDHLADYHAALERLGEKGLLYRDFRTRSELASDIAGAPHGPVGPIVSGAALPADEETERLARGEAFAWRLSLSASREYLGTAWESLSFVEEGQGPDGETGLIMARPELAGDIVLARKDVGAAYHLAVVVDDARQGVSHVIRGDDLFAAAHIQRLLQALLDLPTPIYRHHPLLMGPDGKRLAKRNGAAALSELRQSGETASDVRRRLGLD